MLLINYLEKVQNRSFGRKSHSKNVTFTFSRGASLCTPEGLEFGTVNTECFEEHSNVLEGVDSSENVNWQSFCLSSLIDGVKNETNICSSSERTQFSGAKLVLLIYSSNFS